MKRDALKKVGFYLFADIASKLAPFATLPILANGLGAKEFGQYSLLITIATTFGVFIGFSTQNALNIHFYRNKSNWPQFGRGLFDIWLYIFGALSFATVFFVQIEWARFLWLAALVAYSTWTFQLLVTILQFTEKIIVYAFAQLFRSIVLATIPIALIYLDDLNAIDAKTAFAALGFANLIVLVASTYLLHLAGIFSKRPNLRKPKLLWALKFASPTVLNAASGWARVSFDRYVLVTLAGSTALGLYSLGFQYGSILGVVGLSISRAATNILLKQLNNTTLSKTERARNAQRTIGAFIVLNFLIFLLFCSIVFFGSSIIFPKDYQESIDVTYIIGAAFFLQSSASLATPCLQYISKNLFLGKLAINLSVASLLLAPLCIKYASYMGASIAFLTVWLLHACFSLIGLQKFLGLWAVNRSKL